MVDVVVLGAVVRWYYSRAHCRCSCCYLQPSWFMMEKEYGDYQQRSEYLIAVLWAYAGDQLLRFDSDDPWALFPSEFKDLILAINPDEYLVEALLRITYPATYFSLILVVLIYQGGLCLYYFSRRKYLYAEQD